MKSRILKGSIGSIIFLMLIFLALLCIRPAISQLRVSMSYVRDTLLSRLEQETGLGLSFSKLSPSILSFFRIQDISVYDKQSGEVLLTVQSAVLFYNLFELFTGNLEDIFIRLLVSGIEFQYNAAYDRQIVERLLSLMKEISPQKNDKNLTESAVPDDGLDNTVFKLPFDVELRNISLHYIDDNIDAYLFFRKTIVAAGSDNAVSADIAGRFSGYLKQSLREKLPESLAGDVEKFEGTFTAEGTLFPGLDGSMAKLKIAEITIPALTVSGLDLYVEYIDNKVHISTMQKILPFYIWAEYDVSQQFFILHADADNFNPFDFITVHKRDSLLMKIQGSLFSGKYSLSYSLPNNQLNYSADGGVWISPKLYPGGISAKYQFSGSDKELSVKHLDIEADNISASASLDMLFEKIQISGYADVAEYILPTGGTVSGEIYFDPLEKGFLCFIPQLNMNSRNFTAVQLSIIPDKESFDFSFEFSDYSHIDYGEPGHILIDGSVWLTGDRPYLQTFISIENFFLDSGIRAASFFLDNETSPVLAQAAVVAEPYIITNDLFVSTDFSSITYNIPAVVLANTEKDSEFMLFSIDGNENTVRVSHFDMRYAGQTIQMTAQADISPDYRDVFFSSDCTVNSIPYLLTGNIINGNIISVSGSYGFEAGLDMSLGLEQFTAYLRMKNLPVSLSGYILSLSSDVSAVFLPDNFSVELHSLEVMESSGRLPFMPYLSIAGLADRYGFSFSRFLYSDTVSELQGSGSISWFVQDMLFESLSVNLGLQNGATNESYTLALNIANPMESELSQAAAFEDWYFSSELHITEFPMARILSGQTSDDCFTGSVTATGTFAMPYVSVLVDRAVIGSRTNPIEISAAAALEDGFINIYQGQLSAGAHLLDSWNARFSLKDFSGFLSAHYAFNDIYTLDVPFSVTVESEAAAQADRKSFIPEIFVLTFATEKITGTLTGDIEPITLTLVRSPGRFDLVSDSNTGISGYYLDSGSVELSLGEQLPVRFNMTGRIQKSALDLRFANLSADMKYFTNLLSYPFIKVHGGDVSGWFAIGGYISDPEFSGVLTLQNVDLSCPDYVPTHITSPLALAVIEEDTLRIDNEIFSVGENGKAVLDLQLVFDRWFFDHVELTIRTPQNIPVDVQIPMIRVLGEGGGDIYIYASLAEVNITGSLYAQNTTVSLFASDFQNDFFQGDFVKAFTSSSKSETYAIESSIPVHIALELQTLNKVEIRFDPLLRGLVAPYTKLVFQADTAAGTADLFGDVVLRGGEIVYLNRNFYLREGRIVFDETSSLADPRITVRAETRERDEDGRQVRITLSAANQLLSEFSPTYTASPPKSEREIMEILGQILSADIETGVDVVFAGLDYGVQVLGIRKLEEILRDTLNLDIFSMRTMILQNLSKQLSNSDSARNDLTIGNFLDNTTVYIGKYFGSSIYLDALLHLSYDEAKQRQGGSTGGIVFQPDFGFEMDAPFATIRFGIAPEIESYDINWVESTSISLSWKFAL